MNKRTKSGYFAMHHFNLLSFVIEMQRVYSEARNVLHLSKSLGTALDEIRLQGGLPGWTKGPGLRVSQIGMFFGKLETI
jgi:hypothetical protein